MKLLSQKIGTLHVEIDTQFVIYDEHRQAAEIAVSRAHPTLLEALAAAVVEVDRIEREAAK